MGPPGASLSQHYVGVEAGRLPCVLACASGPASEQRKLPQAAHDTRPGLLHTRLCPNQTHSREPEPQQPETQHLYESEAGVTNSTERPRAGWRHCLRNPSRTTGSKNWAQAGAKGVPNKLLDARIILAHVALACLNMFVASTVLSVNPCELKLYGRVEHDAKSCIS
jgi:hypothetical protein